jgi:hypothetical protein
MSRYVEGVDIGQSVDHTAIAVLQVTTRQDRLNATMDDPKAEPIPMEWYPPGGGGIKDPHGVARIDVRHLERLPLKMAYPAQVEHVKRLLNRPPLDRPNTDLVLDQTGVGRPVVDMFRQAGLDPVAVTITAGEGEGRGEGYRDFRVSKLMLVSRLQAMLHSGELKIVKVLEETQALAWELQDFRATASDAGNWSFGARSGRHDDLVLALAIGVWWANRPMHGLTIGTYRI